MKNKDKSVLILNLETPRYRWNDDGFFHINATIGRLTDDRPEDECHKGYAFISPEIVSGLDVRGLTLSSQGDRRSSDLYSCDVRYCNRSNIDQNDLVRMLATLKKVQKKLDHMNENFGYPKDSIEHFVRFGQALGCVRVYIWNGGSNQWQWRPFPSEARGMISEIIGNALRQYGKPAI